MIEFGNVAHARAIMDAAEKGAGSVFNPNADRVISISSRGSLAGGVVYRDYFVASIAAHVSIFRQSAMTKDFLWVAFDYPFNQLKVKKLLAKIPSRNLKSVNLAKRLGFTLETIITDVFPNADQLIFSMTRQSCRWLDLECHARWLMDSPRGAST